ncbi:hypothetical protein H5410_003056 [Solanum commersonii]|uniref:Uncharacterized protein n=1 Tax=Solanum commersonii TaxID=4109 RepID=A0A9J6B3Z1_SOLCO|nr:hypothetical protein H5410_003056 [Solanum commersonii]
MRDGWGRQQKQTNLQERVSKGGNLSHVMHEKTHLDHSSNFRTPTTTSLQQSTNQQQVHNKNSQRRKNKTPGKLAETQTKLRQELQVSKTKELWQKIWEPKQVLVTKK